MASVHAHSSSAAASSVPRLSFVTLDVFTTEKWLGNPLAVVKVPAGVEIDTPQLQRIAREFNLSETVFLYDGSTAGGDPRRRDAGNSLWRLRIFSGRFVHVWRPRALLICPVTNTAGHPTIGAACYALGALSNNAPYGTFLCNAGPIEVAYEDGMATAEVPHDVHIHTQYPFTVEQVHELQPALEGYVQEDAVSIVSPVKGMNFVLVELPDLEALSKVTLSKRPQPKLDDDWNVGFCGTYFYVLLEAAPNDEGKFTAIMQTRMVEGSFEDPATGSAACALVAYLALRHDVLEARSQVIQGVEMGRRSEIEVRVRISDRHDEVSQLQLSGSAVQVMAGEIYL